MPDVKGDVKCCLLVRIGCCTMNSQQLWLPAQDLLKIGPIMIGRGVWEVLSLPKEPKAEISIIV